MPVFFYIDPDYLEDPFLKDCDEITLSYTFFKSKPGMKLPTYNPGVKKQNYIQYDLNEPSDSEEFISLA